MTNPVFSESQQYAFKRLSDGLLDALPSFTRAESPGELTIGAEHEFFLMNAQGLPCLLEQSQAFLQALASLNQGWRLHSGLLNGRSYWTRVGRRENGSRAEVKYEHDPHLLELTSPVCTSPASLRRFLVGAWQSIEVAAKRCELLVQHIPWLHGVDAIELAARSQNATTMMLLADRHSRVDGCSAANSLAGFPAVCAATQIHIGGLNWAREDRIVERLYCVERQVSSIAYESVEHGCEVQALRESAYNIVFRSLPLVSWADSIRPWSLSGWVAALLESPAVRQHEVTSSVWDLMRTTVHTPAELVAMARDLQYIRPRMSGTLEFRNAPAQPSPDAIFALSEARWQAASEAAGF